MAWKRTALGAAMCAALVVPHAFAAKVAAQRAHEASADTRKATQWILQTADHRGLPFAVVDKKDARLYVFDGKGHLVGDSAVLVGQAPGDESAPDVGKHAAQGEVPYAERTTPAGRFVSHPGLNPQGEPIVWVDYESAFAIHRLRPGPSFASRKERLASPSPKDNRASWGCVVVPEAFYVAVVDKVLGQRRAIVYVLPESGQLRDLVNAF